MKDNNETPEQKRERIRHEELNSSPTGNMNDALNRANSGSLVDLVGSLGWKGTGMLILILIALFFTTVIIYNYNQQPTTEDVINITNNWSPQTEEVYLVRKIDGKWLTIFRNQHSVIIAELNQNWFGSWDIRDEMGGQSSLASIYYPPKEDDEVTWGAGGIEETNGYKEKEITYYFGQVLNTNIQKIRIETNENTYEDIPIIVSNNRNRFFFKKVNGQMVMPINIRGYSESGELIFSTNPDSIEN